MVNGERSSSPLSGLTDTDSDELTSGLERVLQPPDSHPESSVSVLSHALRAARPSRSFTLGNSLEGHALVGGRIRVGLRIGGGAMGVVYDAFDGNRNVALKVLHRLQEIHVYRLKTEFRQLAQLNHPNVICVYELFNEDSEWFFSMERVHGLPLHRHLEERYLTGDEHGYETELRSLLRQLIEGMAAIHEAGLIHRDIKPTNLLVSNEGQLVILDFGLVSEQYAGGVGQTIDNRVSGTMGYIAPELLGGAPATAASDYYALGATLHQLLTGRMPNYDADTDRSPLQSSVIGGLPSDLSWLCGRLLSLDPKKRPDIAELLELCSVWPRPTRRARTSSPPSAETFVGRRDELQKLAEVSANPRSGTAPIALVHGARGIGKSALLRQFGTEMRSQGALVLVGRCSEWETVPYKGFDEVIDQLSRLAIKMSPEQAAHLVPRHAAAVVRVFPALLRVEAFCAAADTRPSADEEWLLHRHAVMGIKDALYRLAERHRVVIVIDDLQWADADTVQLLTDLLTPPTPPNMFLIAGVADGAPTRDLASELSRAGTIASFTLGALDQEDTRELALTLLPDARKAPSLVDHVVQESRGIPLYVAELAEVPESLWQSGSEGVGLLSQSLLHRVERLEPTARGLLDLIAVAAHPMTMRVADACGGVEIAKSSLRQLMAERLVCSIALPGDGLGFRPYTELVRQVLLQVMSAEHLTAQHATLARALEAVPDAEPEWLLVHYRGAGHYEQAKRHALIVAERALQMMAFEQAASMYKIALELSNQRSSDWIELNVSYADTLVKAGHGAAAARAYECAAESAASDRQTYLRNLAVNHWIRSGHIVEGVALLRRTLVAAKISWPKTSAEALARLLAQRALIRLRGLGCQPRQEADVSVELLRKIDALHPAQTALGAFDYLRGATFAAIALPLALKAGEPKRLVIALAGEAVYQTMLNGLEGEARTQTVQRRIDDLRSHGTGPYEDAVASAVTAICAYWTGRWRNVLSPAAQAESLLRRHVTGALWESSLIRSVRHTVLLHSGRYRDFAEELPDELAYASVRDDRYAYLDLLRRSISIHLARDEADEALAALHRLSELRRRYPFLALDHLIMSSVVATLIYVGDAARAREEFAARAAECRRDGMDRLPLVRITLLGMEGDCTLAQEGSPELRARHLEKLARAAAREPIAWAKGLTAALRGSAAELLANRAEAATQYRSATASFETAGLTTAAMVARLRLQRVLNREVTIDDGPASARPESWLRDAGIKRPDRWASLVHSLY